MLSVEYYHYSMHEGVILWTNNVGGDWANTSQETSGTYWSTSESVTSRNLYERGK